jgi:hypothetical protein
VEEKQKKYRIKTRHVVVHIQFCERKPTNCEVSPPSEVFLEIIAFNFTLNQDPLISN